MRWLSQLANYAIKTNTLTPFGLWRTRIIHSVLVSGRVRCRSPYLSVPPVFKTGSQAAVITLPIIVVPQGFEPQFHGPKPCVLPIRRGNNNETNMSKNFLELRTRFELIFPDYKSGASPTMLTEPI